VSHMRAARITKVIAVAGFALVGQTPLIPAYAITETTHVLKAPSTRTVIDGDNGTRLTLHVGDRLLIKLGGDWDWSLEPFDTAILRAVTESGSLPRGAQALLEATKRGETKLSLIGDPPCAKSRPSCNAPSRHFQADIIVQ
jgi:hypothetical protein